MFCNVIKRLNYVLSTQRNIVWLLVCVATINERRKILPSNKKTSLLYKHVFRFGC